jgi:hypothetical protein
MSQQMRIALSRAPGSMDEHLRACVDDTDDVDDLARADVLYFTNPIAADDAIVQLAAYPGCVICAGTTDDGVVLIAVRGGIAGRGSLCAAVASIVHAVLVQGVETAYA